MMTSIVQESAATTTITTATSSASNGGSTTTTTIIIPPHVLLVGKKNALDYIAPALFRIGTFGELVVRAKGSLSIVTAVNVAEMVKKDVAGLETRSISIGTEELVFEGTAMPKRVSYIEIHLAKPAPKAAEETPLQDKLAETASTAKKIRAKAKKSPAAAATKKRATAARKQKADA